MKIDKQNLLLLYLEEVNEICDQFDWKTKFEPHEIIYIIAHILESNVDLIDSDEYSRGYEAGLNAAYISNQSSRE